MNKEITPPPFTVVNEKGKERKVKHGNYAYQKKLCRCDFCKKTASTSIKKYTDLARERFKADPTSLTNHGTYGYQIGCRCTDCTKMGTKISEERNAKAIERFKADPSTLKKHGVYGYQIGCRCDVCETSNNNLQLRNQFLSGEHVGDGACLIGYQHGCRCTDCKKAESEVSKQRVERAIERFKADPSTLKTHGYYGYQLGCRCDVCKTARTQQTTDSLQKQKEHLKKTGEFLNKSTKHGTSTGYRYGCRCDGCRQWKKNQSLKIKSDSVQEVANG